MELTESPSTDSGIRHEALSLASYITEFKFLVSVVIWHDILFQVNIVSKSMQSQIMDIATLTYLLKNCVKFIIRYRETGYQNALCAARLKFRS